MNMPTGEQLFIYANSIVTVIGLVKILLKQDSNASEGKERSTKQNMVIADEATKNRQAIIEVHKVIVNGRQRDILSSRAVALRTVAATSKSLEDMKAADSAENDLAEYNKSLADTLIEMEKKSNGDATAVQKIAAIAYPNYDPSIDKRLPTT